MIYLDSAAMHKPKDEVIALVNDILANQWYNPNSVYTNGQNSKQIVNKAKEIIAKEINCEPNEIIVTSCGSESNSLATCGYIRANNLDCFVTSTIEHASISENPYGRKLITVDQYGFFNMDDIRKIHDSLVSIQIANSEIGTIQKDFKEIVKILHENNCIVHTDAVALFGKKKINVRELGVDMTTATAQKIGGILGCAFLYVRDGIKLEPLIWGHNTLRGGTPNVAAIGVLGKAIELLDYSSTSYNRDYVWDYIEKNIEDAYVVGADKEHRLVNNIFCCIPGIEGESLQILLDSQYQICVSVGSACNSGSLLSSPILTAIGMSDVEAHSCIRITLNGDENIEELDEFCLKLKECVEMLRRFSKR